VLINPRSTHIHEIAQKVFPPLNLLYLAASLREHGFEPVLLEANALALSDAELVSQVRRSGPALVGISLYTDILAQVHSMGRMLKAECPGIRLVLGGPHATSWPRRTLEQFPEADYVLRGEAESSLPALAGGQDLATIPGLLWRGDNGEILQGAEMELPDPEALPLPARDLVQDLYDHGRYYALMVRTRPVDALISSRGCPFDCGFCYNFRRRYRARSPGQVVDELALIRRGGIRDVEICDDTFTVNRARALAIFDLIIKRRLDISFRIKSRVDVFDEELAARAARAGVYMVSFGMESGSARMLDRMAKGVTPALNARAAALCKRHGIHCHSSWIVGYPGETLETVAETEALIRAIHADTVNIGVLRPYPGTAAHEEARAAGTLVGDWSPQAEDPPWIRLPWAPDRQVLDDLVRRMMRQVYLSPRYMISMARQVVRGGNITLGRYAVQESFKLARAGLERLT